MVGLFRTNQFVANILLLLYALLLRFPGFIRNSEDFNLGQGGTGWEIIGGPNWDWSGIQHGIFSLILIVAHGFIINIIENRYKLTGELNLVPGMSYVLIVSCISQSFYVTPLLIGITFLLFAINQLLACYKNYLPATEIFNVGLFLSIAFLFYTSFWFYIFFAILSLVVLRNFKFKELLMLLIGFLVPLILVGVYYYWNGRLDYFVEAQFINGFSWKSWAFSDSLTQLFPIILLAIFLIFALVQFGQNNLKKGIQERKGIDILYWSLVTAGVTLFLQPYAQMDHLILLVPALGYTLSFALLRLQGSRAEAAHLMIFLVIILWQFNPWGG